MWWTTVESHAAAQLPCKTRGQRPDLRKFITQARRGIRGMVAGRSPHCLDPTHTITHNGPGAGWRCWLSTPRGHRMVEDGRCNVMAEPDLLVFAEAPQVFVAIGPDQE